MDLKTLEVFCRIVELKSFTRAAEAVSLTQPTVSEHIKDLEGELGVAPAGSGRPHGDADPGGRHPPHLCPTDPGVAGGGGAGDPGAQGRTDGGSCARGEQHPRGVPLAASHRPVQARPPGRRDRAGHQGLAGHRPRRRRRKCRGGHGGGSLRRRGASTTSGTRRTSSCWRCRRTIPGPAGMPFGCATCSASRSSCASGDRGRGRSWRSRAGRARPGRRPAAGGPGGHQQRGGPAGR